MTLLQSALDAVTAAAGWKPAEPDASGVARFALQGDLAFDMSSPDGRVCILRAELCTLPGNESEADSLLEKCAAQVVGVCRKRSSVLSLQGDRLVLSRLVPMNAATLAGLMPEQVQSFLNDLAWWQAQISGSRQPASPFSAPGGMNFWTMR